MKKPDEDAMIAKEKATWQAYKDKRADDFKKLVSPDLVAMNANREIRGLTKLVKYLTIILLLAIPDLIHAKSELTADDRFADIVRERFRFSGWEMEDAQPAPQQATRKLSGVDGIRLLG